MNALPNARRLDLLRANKAWECVQGNLGSDSFKEYVQLARGAAADIVTNGLGPTLAFWSSKHDAHHKLFEHVSSWLSTQISYEGERDLLAWVVKKADTPKYRRATAEAIEFLVWLKRFAEAASQ